MTDDEVAFAQRIVDEHAMKAGPKSATRVCLRLYRDRWTRQEFEYMRAFFGRFDGYDYQSEAEFA